MPSDADLRARLYLLRAAEPPALAVHQYVAAAGPVEAVRQITNGTAPAAVLNEISRPDATIDDDLHAIDNGTARLLTPEDRDWPLAQVAGLTSRGAPLGLWTRGSGDLAELLRSAVTIDGARSATPYGIAVATDFS